VLNIEWQLRYLRFHCCFSLELKGLHAIFLFKLKIRKIFLSFVSLPNHCHYVKTLPILLSSIARNVLAVWSLYIARRICTLKLVIITFNFCQMFEPHWLIVLIRTLSISPLQVSRFSNHEAWLISYRFVENSRMKRLFRNTRQSGHTFELRNIYISSWLLPSFFNVSLLFNHWKVQRPHLL